MEFECEVDPAEIDNFMQDYDDIVKIEIYHYIAANNPKLVEYVSPKAIELIDQYQYGAKYLDIFQAGANNLDAVISQNIRGCQARIETLSDALQDLEQDEEDDLTENSKFVDITEELRSAYFKLAVQHLANDEYSNAAAALNIYAPRYPSSVYSFRDYERSCFVAYLSGRYDTVNMFKNKLSDAVASNRKEQTLGRLEVISLWKIKWAILMANFHLERYQTVKEMFYTLIDPHESTLEDISALDVLEHHLVPHAGNCYNYITNKDVKIASLLATIVSSNEKELTDYLKLPVNEDLFEKCHVFLRYAESVQCKSFKTVKLLAEKIGKSFVRINYNLTITNWNYLQRLIQIRLVLFYLSLIEKISLADLAKRVYTEEKQLLQLLLSLISILNLNIVYDPIESVFTRTISEKPNLTLRISSLASDLEADNESSIVQTLLLKELK